MISLLLPSLLALLTVAQPPAPTPRSRTFTFDYAATIPAQPAGTKAVDLWLPVPHDDKSQQIRDLQVTSPVPYEIKTGAYGNRILHLRATGEALQGFTVDMRLRATRREHLALVLNGQRPPREAPDPNLRRWLAADSLVPLDPQIRLWALEVATKAQAKTDLEKARAVYEHVVSTVKYDKTGQGWGRGDIYYACDARRGNCTDFHAVFIGYCRALGIPARFSIGFPLPPERGTAEIKGYHCWAEFYTPETGWVPVDASEAAKNPDRRNYFFGAHDENRLEFTRGRDLVLVPRQNNPALNYFIYPYAEADGKPLTGVKQAFRVQDVVKK
ncbi:transglutaminase-like putative cysteine protease [Hymenobacter luteus]|uniref:Transglutaminase-like putative cysteine protease n=2 Tax=Hymenobacter TaxID=89966 RepID=A0A7W9WBX6_9BACT|nr:MULTISPECIES: transglutaminase domain-containing protein [Hymenobacter]MBB4599588.1 transglutaminase-like putative cysteine protease [Hymenobacter latericoloratus]MBB6058102.1 transglutaminase-like putative cysteine protease [Hymenobacter luteus]